MREESINIYIGGEFEKVCSRVWTRLKKGVEGLEYLRTSIIQHEFSAAVQVKATKRTRQGELPVMRKWGHRPMTHVVSASRHFYSILLSATPTPPTSTPLERYDSYLGLAGTHGTTSSRLRSRFFYDQVVRLPWVMRLVSTGICRSLF